MLCPFKPSKAQSPYEFDTGQEIGIAGGAIALNVAVLFWQKRLEPIPDSVLRGLDAMDVNAFDRIATKHIGKKAQRASDILFYSSFALPLLANLNSNSREHFGQISLMYLETLALTGLVTNFTKTAVKRKRPYTYFHDIDRRLSLAKEKGRDAQYSFFSGHSSASAAMSFYMAQTYSDFNPDSKAKPFVWTTAAIYPAIVAALRVRAGKHFPTDVITGYIVGAALGILVPKLHQIK